MLPISTAMWRSKYQIFYRFTLSTFLPNILNFWAKSSAVSGLDWELNLRAEGIYEDFKYYSPSIIPISSGIRTTEIQWALFPLNFLRNNQFIFVSHRDNIHVQYSLSQSRFSSYILVRCKLIFENILLSNIFLTSKIKD